MNPWLRKLSLASEAAVVEQSETMMVLSSNVQLYPEERLGLGAQQDSLDHYSDSGASSHKFCVDQGGRWVIKFIYLHDVFTS